MSRAIKGWLISFASLVLLTAGVYLAFQYRLELYDRWRLLSYTPPAEVAALADATTMQGRGRDLFYASDPKVQDRAIFNISCTDTGEESLVLGCYKLRNIYIYNVTDERLSGVKEVTAAHEMLHAAYERLQSDERTRVEDMLVRQLAKIKDPRLGDLIALYNRQEPGHLLNEMHSILGTEFSDLSSELERYYAQYFADRSRVVALASGYGKVFTESQARIEAHDSELERLRERIDANTAELNMAKAELDTLAAQLDALRSSNTEAYNSAVPGYNAKVRAYNNLASATRNLVNDYNNLVAVRNQEIAAQNDLYHSLDSNYQTVSTD